MSNDVARRRVYKVKEKKTYLARAPTVACRIRYITMERIN